ncbi:hypothetical protein Hdeb2414_s0018g00533641 [Helianthus debilis subsp. tardiflorus]
MNSVLENLVGANDEDRFEIVQFRLYRFQGHIQMLINDHSTSNNSKVSSVPPIYRGEGEIL